VYGPAGVETDASGRSLCAVRHDRWQGLTLSAQNARPCSGRRAIGAVV